MHHLPYSRGFWPITEEKSYTRIDWNGLNTAIGEAILQTSYPEKYAQMVLPIEKRPLFIEWAQKYSGKVTKCTPPEPISIQLECYCSEDGKDIQYFNKQKSPHGFMPVVQKENAGTPHALIRHPVDRFLSFINTYTPALHRYTEGFDIGYQLDQIFFILKSIAPGEEYMYNAKQFLSQDQFIGGDKSGVKFYKYPEHVSELITDLSLKVQPKKAPSTLIQSFELKPAHKEIILEKYKIDLDLYNSIEYPGIILTT